MKKHRGSLEKFDVATLLRYNEADAEKTVQLAEILWQQAKETYGEDKVIAENHLALVVSKMRQRGKRLNVAHIQGLIGATLRRLEEINREVLNPAGIHGPSDRDGLLAWLRSNGVPISKLTAKGNDSTDEESLTMALPFCGEEQARIINSALEARGLEKANSTWMTGFLSLADAQGILHPNYTVAGTVSYRLSCSNPNAQAVPKTHDDIWMPYWSADYSQAELRLAAMFAGENRMAGAFASGEDFHSSTAVLTMGEATKENRRAAKSTNFASIYGGGVQAIVEATGLDPAKVQAIVQSHRKAYPNLYKVSRAAQDVWKNRKYLTLMRGKRLYATEDDIGRRAYKAFNQLVQGSVAEAIQEAMIVMDKRGIPLVGQVHDSIEYEGEDRREEIAEIMQSVIPGWMTERTDPAIPMLVDIEPRGSRNGREPSISEMPDSSVSNDDSELEEIEEFIG